MWKLVTGVVRIVRPVNCVMFFVGTALGGILALGGVAFAWPLSTPLVLAALSATLVGASGNVLNDVYDVEIDRLNRPTRPLPAGILAPDHARILWPVLALLGLVLAMAVSWLHAGIAGASCGLLFAYNSRLKSVPIAGNLLVSTLVGVSLIYGALSVAGAGPAIPAAVFAFLTTMAREVVKDVEDLAGDRANRSSSFAVHSGPRSAARLSAVILFVTVGLTPVPFLTLGYSGLYLLLIMIADGFMLAAVFAALQPDFIAGAGSASRLIKLAMVVGLVALAVSHVGPG